VRRTAPDLDRPLEILEGMEEWRRACALASRAEAVRAGKARALALDGDVPADVRVAFADILRDEAFHERAFRFLAGEEAMATHVEFNDWCKRPCCEAGDCTLGS
jgi:hypothetical protein